MKRFLIILSILLTTTALSAQDFARRGFSLGADRDTLLYIIASPFDNWYLNLSGNIQTFIGNTPDPQAYWNKLDFGVNVEIGKWLIPDMAVSLRFSSVLVHSQTRHAGNNPWIDYESPINYEGAEEGPYYPMSVQGIMGMGIVTFDWTNFLNGYESGKRKHWHLFTPIGLGIIGLYGEVINPNYVNKVNKGDVVVDFGDIVWNKELAFMGGLTVEYIASRKLSFNLSAEIMGARGSLDDHNYNLRSGQRQIDLIPSIYVGVKFNLLKEVTKYNRYTHTSTRERVNHEFLAYGTRRTIPTLTGRIEQLNRQIDSIQNLTDTLRKENEKIVNNLQSEADSLQQELDSVQTSSDYQPINIVEELLDLNEKLNLPATVVYYQLDKYEIDYNGCKKLQRFAKETNALADTLEYYIVGAADSLTGTIRHNQWLSERRCQAAYNMLVNHFNANRNQYILVPVGGIMEYEPQENNRIALIIQRTPQTEEIINRWLQHKGKGATTIAHPRN